MEAIHRELAREGPWRSWCAIAGIDIRGLTEYFNRACFPTEENAFIYFSTSCPFLEDGALVYFRADMRKIFVAAGPRRPMLRLP